MEVIDGMVCECKILSWLRAYRKREDARSSVTAAGSPHIYVITEEDEAKISDWCSLLCVPDDVTCGGSIPGGDIFCVF